MPKLPGGPLARRPLHFIWIADCSGSMGYGGKIEALNHAIREALPAMQTVAAENPNAEVMEQLDPAVMPQRALPPVLVLISDGQPTDDVGAGLRALMDQPWGEKAVRIAIAIGADADTSVLQRFIGNPELEPLQADTAESLVNSIKWVSTAVLKSASSPASQALNADQGTNVPLPPLPDKDDDVENVSW